MRTRITFTAAVVWLLASLSHAQSAPDGPSWRSPAEQEGSGERGAAAVAPEGRLGGVLPQTKGQVWRQYDISPYTLRVSDSERPQQALIDWILRETGYETWHGETAALLSATPRTLRVYHTPQMQETVAEIVRRFVRRSAETHAYSIRFCTLAHPDWRARAQRVLRPVPVQTAGAEAWLLAKEDAASLWVELSRRSDFRNHGSPRLMVHDGQITQVNLTTARPFVRSMLAPGTHQPGLEPNVGQIEEGWHFEMQPLLSEDGQTIDAMLKCNIRQVERLVPVRLESPSTFPQGRQWYNVEIPQVVSSQFHERFRWPKENVLLVSLGVVPRPGPQASLKLPLGSTAPRGDALILIESHPHALAGSGAVGSGQAQRFRGRY
ncbi:MAG: hypothetical protein GTO03_09915 [Planctomycetales bacterium]|nr:hypothetical protein [Planctomycetales bacterium]